MREVLSVCLSCECSCACVSCEFELQLGFDVSRRLARFMFPICGVKHAVWNSQWTDQNRGTGGRADGTHTCVLLPF